MIQLLHPSSGIKLIQKSVVDQKQISNLVDDVSYIAHEANALSDVIDTIPYNKKPGSEELSIIEMLIALDYDQQDYYRKILEEAFSSNKPISLLDYKQGSKSFETDENLKKDIQLVLSNIARHRSTLISLIENRPLKEWEKRIIRDEVEITVFDFVEEMIEKERGVLKRIAELVLAYQNDRQFHRNVETRINS